MQIWKGVLGWESLFGWPSVGTIFTAALGTGLALMSLDWVPHNLLLAQICFCIAALILAAKLIRHAALSKDPWWHRMLFSFVVCGLLGLVVTETVRFLENEKSKREAKAETARANSQAESGKQDEGSVASANSPALFLSCRTQPLPLMIPAGKSIRIMRLYTRATALDLNTLMEASGSPDRNGIYPPPPIIQRHNIGSPYDLQVAGICDISNRGDVMLRDILFPVRIEFFREHDIRYKEIEPDPRTIRFGPPKAPPAHVIERMVSINPLAVGDTFTFFVVNACSQYVARVSIADNTQVSVLGEPSRRMIRLERSTHGVLTQFVLPVSNFPWTDVEPCT